MTGGRWQLIQGLVDSALDLPAAERGGFLDRECAGDAGLLRQVSELVAASEASSGFFEAALEAGAASALAGQTPAAGDRVGAFQLTAVIGEGGMGTVYSATRVDDQFRQKVAIKAMRPGFAATAEAQARFRAERQILANLNHPNIAKLLDGGVTPAGAPFLVMEFVEGRPIDRYCNEMGLDTHARLRLFREVCAAVQYAHQNLIVHRDIKPANILVTAEGVPKLLDFGIAKLLAGAPDDSASPMTRADERLMTPEYASPEQIRGEAITTAADVYTLGALLYELLTGVRPFRFDSLSAAEIQRLVTTEEPEKPSTAYRAGAGGAAANRREIGADLDNIVLMAMRKEPMRRYASASELSEDIGRFMDGFPVHARANTFRYRAGKFTRRHALPLAVAAAILATLIGAFVETRIAQKKAERRFAEVREMADTLLFDFDDSIAELTGATRARQLLVSRALVYLDRLAAEAAGDEGLQSELATAYEKIAQIQYRSEGPHLGDVKGSFASVKKAIAMRESLLRSHPQDVAAKTRLADTYDIASLAMQYSGDLSGAAGYLAKILPLREAAVASEPGNRTLKAALAEALKDTAEVERLLGKTPAARGHLEQAMAIQSKIVLQDPSYTSERAQAVEWTCMGDLLDLNVGDSPAAVGFFGRALAVHRKYALQQPNNGTRARDFAVAVARYGRALLHAGDLPGAQDAFTEWVAQRKRLAAIDPADMGNMRGLGLAERNLGEVQERTGHDDLALASYRQSVAVREMLLKRNPDSMEARDDAAYGYRELGRLLFKEHDEAGARPYLVQASGLWTPLMRAHPENVDYASRLGQTLLVLGQLDAARGKQAESVDSYRQALAIFSRLEQSGTLPAADRGKAQRARDALSKK